MRVLKTEPNRTGFALIIALSLMAFIVLILVALSAITRMEVGSAESQGARVRAQENAQLGAILAIGRLQRDVGPDSDGSGGLSLQSPEWVGVWDTGTANWENLSQSERLSDAVWLVSGNTGKESSDGDYWTPEADLSAVASEDQEVLARNESVSPVQETVVLRENVGAGNEDYFAYWVSDENTKARVDLHDDFLDSSNNQELINSLNQVARSGV